MLLKIQILLMIPVLKKILILSIIQTFTFQLIQVIYWRVVITQEMKNKIINQLQKYLLKRNTYLFILNSFTLLFGRRIILKMYILKLI